MTKETGFETTSSFHTPSSPVVDGTTTPETAQTLTLNTADPVPDMGAPVGRQEDTSIQFFGDNISLSPSDALTPQSNTSEDTEKESESPIRLGDLLIERKIINEDQLNVALHEKDKQNGMLGEILVELGFITAETLSQVLAQKSGHEEFDPSSTMFDPDALELVTKRDATRYHVLPISVSEKEAVVAMADPYDIVALDKLRQLLPRGIEIKPKVCTPGILVEAIDNAYGYASSIAAILQELDGKEVDVDLQNISEDASYSHPIVRLVNALVFDAVKIGASDIHFEPEENFARLRYRVDGILHTAQTLHKEYWQGISQRLKIMSGMNIADKLTPQDGRFYLNVGGREADFRVSCLPTIHGENIVLRVLDKSSGIMELEDLGFSQHNLSLIKQAQSRPEGIIIVTGPTGSGKTSSLYSMLNKANTVDVNIMTLEDPVEYSLPMIRQTHVKESIGLGFGEGVKALLRQDPDIIFIGEVRDSTTAEQALKAAMTGHQVYTTLHTNDSFGAIPRLLDLGLKPGMLAGAITAVFAQRLARRLCLKCKKEKIATSDECRLLGIDSLNPPRIYEAVGCSHCMKTGYKGRVAVSEILFINEALDDVIANNGSKSELKMTAKQNGFKGMSDDAVLKIIEGVTSIESARKVVNFSDRLVERRSI